jgi:cytochrome c-type biogenesis protein CcmH/NrfG
MRWWTGSFARCYDLKAPMKPESAVFAVAGALFGLIAGWIIGTQQTRAGLTAPVAAPVAATAAPVAGKPLLDESQVAPLRRIAEQDPRNVPSRVQLGNLYFDAERYPEALSWYEQAFALEPGNADVSTDLAVCYYYTDQADRAIVQFEQSLKANPNHAKTFLNMGVVKAFGKQDLVGAAAAWETVIRMAPGTPEATSARRALDSLNAAHPGGTPVPPGSQKPAAK